MHNDDHRLFLSQETELKVPFVFPILVMEKKDQRLKQDLNSFTHGCFWDVAVKATCCEVNLEFMTHRDESHLWTLFGTPELRRTAEEFSIQWIFLIVGMLFYCKEKKVKRGSERT